MERPATRRGATEGRYNEVRECRAKQSLTWAGSNTTSQHARILSTAAFKGREDNLGYVERLAHIDCIRKGAPSYMIMCVAKDPKARPRSIATFNSDDVFVGGALVDENDYSWVELAARKPAHTVRA